jgi:hypothetical protein
MSIPVILLISILSSISLGAPPETQSFQRELTFEAKQPVSINKKKVPAKGPLVLNPNEQQDPAPTKNSLVDISVEVVEDKEDKDGKAKYDHKSSRSGSVAFPWEQSSRSDGKLVWAVDENEARRHVRVEVKNLDMDHLEAFINRTMPEVRRTLAVVAVIVALVTLLVVLLLSCACTLCCVFCRRAACTSYMQRQRCTGSVPYSILVGTVPTESAPIISNEVSVNEPVKNSN